MLTDAVEGVDGLHVHDGLLKLELLVDQHLLAESVALDKETGTSACFLTLVASSAYFLASFFLSAAISSLALFLSI